MGLFGMIGDVAASSLATGGQIAATSMTNAANKEMTESTNQANIDIADKNNQTSIDIANANNQMQRDLNAQNNQFSADEAQKARDYDYEKMLHQEQYNSPLAQIQRYREAGLNPSAMMSGQTAVASSSPASSATASPHGSGVSPSMPLISTPSLSAPQFASLDIFQGLRSLADIAKTHAELKKSQADTKTINDTRELLVEELQEKIRNMKLKNDVFEAFGMLDATAHNQALLKDILLKTQQIETLASEGNLKDAEADWTRWKSATEKSLSGIARKQLDTFDVKFRSDLRESAARANASNASANASNAAANLSREELSQLQDMHQYLVQEKKNMAELRGHEARLTHAQADEKWQTLEDAINYTKSHYQFMRDADKREVDLLDERLRSARHDNDWKVYHEVLDALERINNGITNWIPFAPSKSTINYSDGSWSSSRSQRSW